MSVMTPASYQVRPIAACREASVYFSAELAESLKCFFPEVDHPQHVGKYLTDKVLFFLRGRLSDHLGKGGGVFLLCCSSSSCST